MLAVFDSLKTGADASANWLMLGPITTWTFSSVARRRAELTAAVGSLWSSATIRSTGLPAMPPALLSSATASFTPATITALADAAPPVNETSWPILMRSGICADTLVAPMARVATAAETRPRTKGAGEKRYRWVSIVVEA